MEIICGNILEKFNLDRDGTDLMQVKYVFIISLFAAAQLRGSSLALVHPAQRCCECDLLLLPLQGTAADMDDQDNLTLKLSVKQSISKQKYDAFDALTFAAKAGDVDVVRDLLRRGADINQADYDGRTAFAMVSFLIFYIAKQTA
jgi:ankyrin repeat protein